MHEYSIVSSLIELCEEEAGKHQAASVKRVEVKIGAYSGVEPHLLEVAFATFKKTGICKNADFIMHIQPLKVRCFSCGAENELITNRYCCPKCESPNVEVIDGEEMYLMRLELE
ncbi:MAG: hydrogenase/urease nickel incorporation protein HypA [Sulfurovum sp.]|nr:hydrogenase/urease nickel incorporation protein HypA [Sulfurovum sp.]